MKHTLQSLLMTTVITLPTAFGSEPFSGFEDESTTVEQSSIVTTSQRPRSILVLPPELLRKFSGEVVKENSKEVAEQLSECAVQSSRGITLGLLDLKDVCRLALTSTNWHKIAQPVLTALNIWRHSNVVPRLLERFSNTSENKALLTFLGIKTDESFDYILNAAFALNSWTKKMTANEHKALVPLINVNRIFNDTEKDIIKGLLPNATPNDILRAANGLRYLGFTDRAEALYEKSAQHLTATPDDIRLVADGLTVLRLTDRVAPLYEKSAHRLKFLRFTDRAAALYELAAQHITATPGNIRLAAGALKTLGLIDRAVALYEQSALHPKAHPDDLRLATDALKALGFTDTAAALYEKSGHYPNTDLGSIQRAADGLKALGLIDRAAVLYERAATVYELVANRKNARIYHILKAAEKLSCLGAEYHPKAAALFERWANHQDATSIDIECAANGLRLLTIKHPYTLAERTQYKNRSDALLLNFGLTPTDKIFLTE